jgi:hypothetical protein
MTCCAVVFIFLGSGCVTQTHTMTTTHGAYVPSSHFTYPNSNVTPLGPVKAEITRTGKYPTLEIDDIKKVYHDALSQVQGANILVNLKEDTTYTTTMTITIGLFYGIGSNWKNESTIVYRIEGEAAKMEIGTKPLE